jgi:branched-chain amino acid transport system permease protein
MVFSYQIMANIIITSVIIMLNGLSVSITYTTAKFFNLSQAAIVSLGAYFLYLFFKVFHAPLVIAFLLAIGCSIIISVISEIGIFRYMRNKNLSSFKLLIASIGIYIFFLNVTSLFFGDDIKSIRDDDVRVGYQILGAYITGIQIISIIISVVLFSAILFLIYKTTLGKQIRAVSNNAVLCNIYGINSNKVILLTTAISALLASIAGILIASDADMTPAFGFNYFLYGIVAMIIGGIGSYRGLILGSLLLATTQNLAAWYLDSKWMDATTYIILILFLIWKPLGFGGQRLKKMEV